MGDETRSWYEAATQVRRLQPGFAPADLLHRTSKSVVIGGTLDGHPVVGKVLIDRAPFWRDKFDREIAVNRAFTREAPPVRVPRLVDADAAAGVLIVERLVGRTLCDLRYPLEAVDPADVRAVLDAVDDLSAWRTTEPALGVGWDYQDRLDRYHRDGLLTTVDCHNLTVLLEAAGPKRTFAHGDMLPANVRITSGQTEQVALIDWEFAGQFLPGWDLALLWVLLADDPASRRLIETRVATADEPVQAAFAVDQAMALTREIRIHRDAEPGPWRDHRLTSLAAEWAAHQTRLRTAARPWKGAPS